MADNMAQIVPVDLGFESYLNEILDADKKLNFGTDCISVEMSEAVNNKCVSNSSNLKWNDIKSQYEDMAELREFEDDALLKATELALTQGNLAPLIREELKYSIQARRLREGKPEMTVEFVKAAPDQLTQEEVMRIRKRKEQNREASRRFRQKQQSRTKEVQQECDRLQTIQTQLKFELNQLIKERNELRKTLMDHLKTCPLLSSEHCRAFVSNCTT